MGLYPTERQALPVQWPAAIEDAGLLRARRRQGIAARLDGMTGGIAKFVMTKRLDGGGR